MKPHLIIILIVLGLVIIAVNFLALDSQSKKQVALESEITELKGMIPNEPLIDPLEARVANIENFRIPNGEDSYITLKQAIQGQR